MTYEHMHAAAERENKRLHDRIAELETERDHYFFEHEEALEAMNRQIARAETAEAALAKVTAERDKWRNDVRLMMEDDERDAEKMLQMLIAAGIDPNEDDLGYATRIKAVVDAAKEWRNQAKPRTPVACKLVYAIDALTEKEDG